jgi:hypothetical protein
MAAPAPIIRGSGTTLVARLKVLATLAEGLRARTGPPTPGLFFGICRCPGRSILWPMTRPGTGPVWGQAPLSTSQACRS